MEELIGIHGFKIKNIEDLNNYVNYLNETITPAQQLNGNRILKFKIVDNLPRNNFVPSNTSHFHHNAYIIAGFNPIHNTWGTFTADLRFSINMNPPSDYNILIPEI